MEKKELTVEELKDIVSGAQIIIQKKDYYLAYADAILEAGVSADAIKRLGIEIVRK